MNSIHPTAQIVGDVRMGTDNTVGPLAVIVGPVTIGSGNWFGTGAMVGATPEIRGWALPGDSARVGSGNGIRIGDANVFREYSQVHQGSSGCTVIGSDAYVMNQVYVAHDCTLEDRVSLASSVLLAGHVHIGAGANLGLGAVVHQRRYVGDGAMVGMGSVVTRDVPPFSKAFGNPARVRGANVVGMERSGFDASEIDDFVRIYGYEEPLRALLESHSSGALGDAATLWRRYSSVSSDE